MPETPPTIAGSEPRLDAIVIGAGFGGLYMLHRLTNHLGLRTRLFDRAGGVGGTWFWNRYPGARSDVESYVYSYSFDPDLRDDWEWQDRYPQQAEILSYLEHVADRFDLRRHMQLATGVTSACFDEQRNEWEVRTDRDEFLRCRYLVTAMGVLSAANLPEIPGRDAFKGQSFHTSRWPHDSVDFAGKRVAVIGTGSTGVQLITAIAPLCDHLTVYQRSPQYSVPARYGPMPADFIAGVKADYAGIWQRMRTTFIAAGFEESATSYHDVSEEERQAVFETAWQRGGGFRFMFGTFYDIATDRAANEGAAAFIREKIRTIVKDKDTARKLTPTGLYAKRPICDMGYFDTFNRSNVTLVDMAATPIRAFTADGILTEDGEQTFDIVIYATGFEAVDGSYLRMDIRGRGGLTLQESWKDGSSGYLGIATSGFPNMFMILGANSVFANIPPVIEAQVEWISDLIARMDADGHQTVEVTKQAERGWVDTCIATANATLFPQVASWIFAANIPGKPVTVMFNMAGLGNYRQVLADAATSHYAGMVFDERPVPSSIDHGDSTLGLRSAIA